MTAGKVRLLEPGQIPATLWDRVSDTLNLPTSLARAYETRVDRLGLRTLATSRSRGGGPVGGLTKESADHHFAQAFDGSAARAILAAIDPKCRAGSTSDAFIKSTAGTTLALTDAPCGAGAAALAFLTVVAELRAHGVLPRLPLEVKFVGGELSLHAVEHAAQLFEEVSDDLEAQAIFVDKQFHRWDVLDRLSTSDLIKASTVHGASCSSKLLVIANFNGFLVKERKQKEAQPQLDELLRHASGPQSLAVWIEPEMNRATASGGIFSWLFGLLEGGWRLFAKADPTATKEVPSFTSVADFRLPLQPTQVFRVTLAVMPMDLTRSGSS
jgi:hypothetical protein